LLVVEEVVIIMVVEEVVLVDIDRLLEYPQVLDQILFLLDLVVLWEDLFLLVVMEQTHLLLDIHQQVVEVVMDIIHQVRQVLVDLVVVVLEQIMVIEILVVQEILHQSLRHKEILADLDLVNLVVVEEVVPVVLVDLIKLVVLVFNFQRLSKIQHLNQDQMVVDLVILDLVDIIGLLVVAAAPIMVEAVEVQTLHHMQVLVKVALILQYLAHQVDQIVEVVVVHMDLMVLVVPVSFSLHTQHKYLKT
jgi:hypothetical protein